MLYQNYINLYSTKFFNVVSILLFKNFSVKKFHNKKKLNTFNNYFFFSFLKKNSAVTTVQKKFFNLFFFKNCKKSKTSLVSKSKLLKSDSISSFFLSTIFFKKRVGSAINGVITLNSFQSIKYGSFVQNFLLKNILFAQGTNSDILLLGNLFSSKIQGYIYIADMVRLNYNWYSFSLYNWKQTI